MFDKLKKLFVVSDEEFQKNAGSSSENPVKTEAPSNTSPSPTTVRPVSRTPMSGEPDQKFLNILMGAIEKQNQEGFDYLEFKQSLQNLKGVVPDEATRYNSAIAMAKTMGASKDSIIQAATIYLNVLKSEETKFAETVNIQRQRLAQEQTNGVAEIKNDIQLKKQQIEHLKKEVADLENKLSQSEQEIIQQADKIQSTTDQFALAYQSIVNQITVDINNLNKFVTQ